MGSYANSLSTTSPHPRPQPLNSLDHKTPNPPTLLTPSPPNQLQTRDLQNPVKIVVTPMMRLGHWVVLLWRIWWILAQARPTLVRTTCPVFCSPATCILLSGSGTNLASTFVTSLSSPLLALRLLDLKGRQGRFEKDWQAKGTKLEEGNWQVPT